MARKTELLQNVFILFWIFLNCNAGQVKNKSSPAETNRASKLLPIFQVVRFPNDPCVSGGSKNGTCYTEEECTSRSGVVSGSCASGFGVCCVFTISCGSSSSENCTYFDSSALATTGACRAKICKFCPDICQFRLDFNTFAITGPSTSTVSAVKLLNGVPNTPGATGKTASTATQCLTDTFVVSNQNTLPVICGTNTGEHVYFEASDTCHDLDFTFGINAIDATVATRQFEIKVTQYTCDFDNLAPAGCDQYFFGIDTTTVKSFNFDGGYHLSNQDQNICVRICWTTQAVIDFRLSGVTIAPMGYNKASLCCGYGATGMATMGYDCVMIPGALKATDGAKVRESICGRSNGLVTTTSAIARTICSLTAPFQINFKSDMYEFAIESKKTSGFKLQYFQKAC